MKRTRRELEIEDLTEEEIKNHPILYVKRIRRTQDRDNKIQDAIKLVHAAVKRKVKYHVSLRVLYEVWPDCISSAKETMKYESHYTEMELIQDGEDLPLFDDLLEIDHENNLKEWKAEKEKKEKLNLQRRGQKTQKENGQKQSKHRTGMNSKLPLKSRSETIKHPKLDNFAQRKFKQQEALVDEFYKLKDEFTKSNENIVEDKGHGDFWPFICEKYQAISPEDYDACTYEILGEFEKILEEE